MALLERPQLRPYLAAGPESYDRSHYLIWDQLRLSDRVIKVTALEMEWMQLFDGERSLRDIQAEAIEQIGGEIIPLEIIQRLVSHLDEALFLDSPRYRQRIESPVRPPCCVHHYETNPGGLRQVIEELFTRPGGPGLPRDPHPDPRLRAVLVPHMDYARGGTTYAWAFKEVLERTPASLFVIIGTSHYSRHRFTLTRKHFETPLGIARTDQEYIDRLVQHYGPGLFDDELMAHLPEHSIELEVAFLQWYYADHRPFRIVPLVVGSFHDCIHSGREPSQADDVGRMIRALRAAEKETPEPICYLISGDLAHIGPKFGDPHTVSEDQLTSSKEQDQAILRQAERADPAGYFRVIADESDERRICGLPPTYTVMEAFRPTIGKVLAYDQYVDPRGRESVSFASVAFDR
jgi:AmmeMemoRadiSam system protein B